MIIIIIQIIINYNPHEDFGAVNIFDLKSSSKILLYYYWRNLQIFDCSEVFIPIHGFAYGDLLPLLSLYVNNIIL
jgi:hypothetical protein